jgi:hypothetical protein
MAKHRGVAGDWVRQLELRTFRRRRKRAFLLLVPVLIASAAGWALWLRGAGFAALLPFGCALIALKSVGRWLDKRLLVEGRIAKGIAGEEEVAEVLGLLDDDTYVYHDVVTPFGNIDHVVLSPCNGLLIIETKPHSGTVAFAGSALVRNGRHLEKDFVGQLTRNGLWLRDELCERLGRRFWIHYILVFTNAHVDPWCRTSVKGVHIVWLKRLLSHIKSLRSDWNTPLLLEQRWVLEEVLGIEPIPASASSKSLFGKWKPKLVKIGHRFYAGKDSPGAWPP